MARARPVRFAILLALALAGRLVAGGSLTMLARAEGPMAGHAQASLPITPLEPIPTRADNVALGERLFGDTRLSRGGNLACASCHNLSRGGTDGRSRSQGSFGTHDFNALSVFNVALNHRLNWRGTVRIIEEESEAVITDPGLMGGHWTEILKRLAAEESYRTSFGAIYGPQWSKADVLDALAEFQRSLVTPNSRFDRYLKGDRAAISSAEERGFRLFENYGCVACHQGANVGGNLFQKFGIFAEPFSGRGAVTEADLGRYTLTGREEDRSVFRVPSLRNVALTAPYFHDGSVQELDRAVAIMARTQLGRELPQGETDLIVQFLGTLTGEYAGVPLERNARAAPP